MTRELTFGRQAARSGRARSLVVFVHGYGANGADLLGLAEPLAPHLPDTVFVAPDAPEPCLGNPFGFQWFPVPWLDGSSPEAAAQGLAASAGDLNAFLDARLADEGLADQAMALVGFSQGSMMSLHVAPRPPARPAAARRSGPGRAVRGYGTGRTGTGRGGIRDLRACDGECRPQHLARRAVGGAGLSEGAPAGLTVMLP